MPQPGTSSDHLGDLEDHIAYHITARDHLQRIATLIDLLHQRGHITTAYRLDALDSVDAINHALQLGKRNTARLRNQQEP